MTLLVTLQNKYYVVTRKLYFLERYNNHTPREGNKRVHVEDESS